MFDPLTLAQQKRLTAQHRKYSSIGQEVRQEGKIPHDVYIMTPGDLEEGLRRCKAWFGVIQSKGYLGRPNPNQPTAPVAPMQTAAGKNAQTSNRNAPQRSVGGKEQAPAAPTSDKPPFSFESPRPDGVPKYNERPGELTRDSLKLPQKKRKLNDTSASPVQTPPSKAVAAIATPPPPHPASPQMPFKCSAPNCSSSKQGFPTAEALHHHTETAHREEDPENPLEFCLESMRHCLGLDKNGKLNQNKPATSQPMKQSSSAQGRTPGKMEGGTPMSRIATGNRSNLGAPRTPQESGTVKSTGSDATPGKGSRIKSTASAAAGIEPLTPPPDLWSGVGMSPAELASHFPTAAEIQSTLSLTSLTPASTLSSNKSEKNSPKPGNEVTESGPLDVSISASDWMPNTFFADTEPGLDINAMFATDDFLDMDWDVVFPKEKPAVGKDGKPIKQKRATVDEPAFNFDLFEGRM